jgi:argininosuccinate lyase
MAKFWGSRFEKSTDALADDFSFSIDYDYRLALYDVIGGIAHAQMLGEQKIIAKKESARLVSGLKQIGDKIEKGTFKFNPKIEDIHTQVQQALKKLIGETADKLHTARSRNDLITLDMRLYCLIELTGVIDLIAKLQKAIVVFADAHKKVIIPAYTHLQSAQVVLLAHHMLAYVEMLERDKSRLQDCLDRLDTMPLGSCALSGTTLPIDRKSVSRYLGFSRPAANSIDAVSDRDFIIEALCALSIVGMHFSRMAEDLILWATKEFHFIDIDGSLCTGSSIMPHKKNPDILELIRGETATLYANLQQLLVLTKGLPLTYNRDLQLDKPPLFESVEKVKTMTRLWAKLFQTLKVNEEAIERRIHEESFFTVDIMEYLIKKGVPYRKAHDTVGNMVKNCLDKGKSLTTLTLKEWKGYHEKFEEDVKKLIDPKRSVTLKQSWGSTNPRLVNNQLKKWKKVFNVTL